jgi:hypothetical protein
MRVMKPSWCTVYLQFIQSLTYTTRTNCHTHTHYYLLMMGH